MTPLPPAQPRRLLPASFATALSVALLLLLRLPSYPIAGDLTDRQWEMIAAIPKERVTARWAELSESQLRDLDAKVKNYQKRLAASHLAEGLVVSLTFPAPPPAPSAPTPATTPSAYADVEKSAAWTGLLLAGLSFRHAVDRHPDSLATIQTALHGVDRLLLVSGHPGLIPGFAARSNDPLFAPLRSQPEFSPGEGPYSEYSWRRTLDRDNYSGLNFGLATTYELIRDPRIRNQISNQISTILRRLIADDWRLDNRKDPPSFVTPLLSLALLRSGATVNPREFSKLYEDRFRESRDLADVPVPGVHAFSPRYSDAVFALANLSTLARLETNQNRRLVFQDRGSQLWRETSFHLNAWFAASYSSVFRSTIVDSYARATLQGVLHLYPAPPRWAAPAPLPLPSPAELPRIHANGQSWSPLPLPLPFQSAAPFQWVQSPFQIDNHSASRPVLLPAVDLIVPYWMARESGLIPEASPAATPPR